VEKEGARWCRWSSKQVDHHAKTGSY